ncbi:MAG: RNA polymerase factor sigma-32 [Pseudobdellovibrio sp.]
MAQKKASATKKVHTKKSLQKKQSPSTAAPKKTKSSPKSLSSTRKKLKTPVKQTKIKTVVAEIVDDDTSIIDSQSEIAIKDLVTTHETDQSDTIDLSETSSQLPSLVDTSTVSSKDSLTQYLNEIRKYPVLSKEEEMRIAKVYFETKDPEAAQALVRANLRFVVKIAAEYARFSSRMIDLIQEGNVGLMHAVKEFNPYKGARLITYAVWWIRGYIQEYLMRQFSMVRIGTTANQRKLFYQLQRQKQELEKMSSPEKIAELSHQLGIPEDEIAEMAKRLSGRDVSLDKTTDDENSGGVSLGSLLKKDDGSLPLDEQLALAEQIKYLKDAIDLVTPKLTEKEKIILEERVLNDEPLTLQEIGEKYKITREAVRQNEVRLINKIKEALTGLMEKKSHLS